MVPKTRMMGKRPKAILSSGVGSNGGLRRGDGDGVPAPILMGGGCETCCKSGAVRDARCCSVAICLVVRVCEECKLRKNGGERGERKSV